MAIELGSQFIKLSVLDWRSEVKTFIKVFLLLYDNLVRDLKVVTLKDTWVEHVL